MPGTERVFQGVTLVSGDASGRAITLAEPLNAWGGLDPSTGEIIHHSHPQRGQSLAGRVLVMQESRGSGTNAQVFAQAWANGCGPRAVVLATADFVLCVGAVVSQELYAVQCPVVVLDAADYNAIAEGDAIVVHAHQGHAEVTVISGAAEPAPIAD